LRSYANDLRSYTNMLRSYANMAAQLCQQKIRLIHKTNPRSYANE